MGKISRICNVAATLLVAAVILAIIPLVLPRLFGLQIYGVLSESMEPQIKVGSVVYVKSSAPEDCEAGDIISFEMGGNSQSIATHRVIEIDRTNQIFRTKGDNNDSLDAGPVSFSRYIGKVVFDIPYLGNFASFIQSAKGIITGVLLLAGACALWAAGDHFKKKQLCKEESI